MSLKRILVCTAALGALAGCLPQNRDMGTIPAPRTPPTVTAELKDASGKNVGTAVATQVGKTINVRVNGMGLPPGPHGIHVHMVGECTAPDFASAGAHWNPTERQHGRNNPAGRHKGDLPNIVAGQGGLGSINYIIEDASVSDGPNALMDADGASIVIHAAEDDYATDPSGNSGDRIACGVFR